MKEITKAQEDVLKALWTIEAGAIGDVVNELQEPKPAYNTVAKVIKVLEKKGYLAHKTYGKTNVYHPIISKKEYAHHVMKDTFRGLFNSSVNQLGSFFVKNKDVSIQELEKLKDMLEQEIKNKKK